jgi:chaperonin cofactor prefoldin
MDDLEKQLAKTKEELFIQQGVSFSAINSLQSAFRRIEALEKALRHCANAIAELEKCKSDDETRYRLAFGLEGFLFGALDNARAALEEKKDG